MQPFLVELRGTVSKKQRFPRNRWLKNARHTDQRKDCQKNIEFRYGNAQPHPDDLPALGYAA